MSPPIDLNRRQILAGLGAAAALACVGTDVPLSDDDTSSGGGDIDSAPGGDTSTEDLLGWATGGTAALVGSYPVDFDDGSCVQTCELTLGPCYAETLDRKDISEGVEGLPTRMSFQVVDTDCQPVAGAVVDVWHCSPSGLYSGQDAADMCTNGDSEARSGRWFRGTRTADDEGVVHFDTCLPGWYSGRAVHIHFQVRVDGDAYVTSQLGFPQSLLTDIYGSHPDYASRGQPDTPNTRDNILSRDLDAHLFSWRQAEDGALVLWKTVVLRRTLQESTC